jgi:ABC-type dipeptide/oligopeptide/nickel transport system permease subunit
MGVASLLVTTLLVVIAIFAPMIWGQRAIEQNVADIFGPPSAAHWVGADELGRDIFARTMVATRLSLLLAALSLLLAAGLGVTFGLLVGLARGYWRAWGSGAIDAWLGFPAILLALVIVTVVGPGREGAVLAIGVAFSPYFARLTMTLSTSVSERDYVVAARLAGVSRRRIFTRYILPNIGDSLAIAIFAGFGECLVAVAALSFLGLGTQSPDTDWGQLLTEGVRNIYTAPAAAAFPGVLIALAGVALALLGDVVARALNPRRTR